MLSPACIKKLRSTARQEPLHSVSEHHPQRAKMLRLAIASSGKNIAQHTAAELIAINKTITQQIEATHEAA